MVKALLTSPESTSIKLPTCNKESENPIVEKNVKIPIVIYFMAFPLVAASI